MFSVKLCRKNVSLSENSYLWPPPKAMLPRRHCGIQVWMSIKIPHGFSDIAILILLPVSLFESSKERKESVLHVASSKEEINLFFSTHFEVNELS